MSIHLSLAIAGCYQQTNYSQWQVYKYKRFHYVKMEDVKETVCTIMASHCWQDNCIMYSLTSELHIPHSCITLTRPLLLFPTSIAFFCPQPSIFLSLLPLVFVSTVPLSWCKCFIFFSLPSPDPETGSPSTGHWRRSSRVPGGAHLPASGTDVCCTASLHPGRWNSCRTDLC